MARQMAIIRNPQGKKIAYLNNIVDLSYNLKLNSLWTAEFTLPKDDKKNIYCQPYNLVEIFDDGKRVELFRIMPSTLKRSDISPTITYSCEHVLSTLMDSVLFRYHQIGGLGVYTNQILRYILDRQADWKLGECDFKRQFEYKFENENLLSALFSVPQIFKEKYRWEFDTFSKPWTLHLRKMPEKWKIDIQYRKNLKSIEKLTDPTNLITRLYCLGYGEGDNQLGIESINDGKAYIEKNIDKYGVKSSILTDRRFESAETLKSYGEKMLEELSEPYISYKIDVVTNETILPGDKIYVRDLEDDINYVIPVVEIKKKLDDPLGVNITVANKERDIAGSIADLQSRARINETYSQGATNLLQMSCSDNADSNKPLKFKVYIPQEMARINKLLLTYTLEPFRAYSKATKGGGAISDTTSSGGGDYTSTESGGGNYVSDTTSTDGGYYDSITTQVNQYYGESDSYGSRGHNHGITPGIRLKDEYDYKHEWSQSGNHDHRFEIDISSHSHSVSFNIPAHEHQVRIDSHMHSFTLPDHTHNILYGIYEGDTANYATLKIDGKSVNDRNTELDIIPYLSKDGAGKITRGTWHTIEIIPNKLTRIDASLFVQLFVNSRGRGDF